MSGLDMGTVNKYLLLWDTIFWDKGVQYIGYTSQSKGAFNFFQNLSKYSTTKGLMTFTFGNYSVEAEKMPDEEIINQIMRNLKTIYTTDLPNPVKFLRTKWNTNKFSYGSYSYVNKDGNSKAFEVLSQDINKQVFFAGEHTSKDYRGTVHGAYLSGLREAKKIIKLIP